MEYAIDKLCKLAGVTSRTLRHYHRIGLLTPLRVNSAGYRIYGPREVDRLQHILFFRALGVDLAEIGRILDASDFDPAAALREHLRGLLERRAGLDRLIETVSKTIESQEGERMMSDHEKFEGFKAQMVAENREKYGDEATEKYGEAEVRASEAKLMGLSEAEFADMTALGQRILDELAAAIRDGASPTGEAGQAIARLHRRWLGFTWPSYSVEAHHGLAQMYADDGRFAAFYDAAAPGAAVFLRDAILGL